MSKTFVLLSVIIATGFAGLAYPPVGPQTEEHVAIEALEKQRVQLLQDRVAGIKTMVDLGLAAQSELLRPEIDVISARLEYTGSDVARKKLAGELLTKYDALIQLAEERASNPPPHGDRNVENHGMHVQSELLYLKSERIRMQITHNTAG